MIEKIEHAITNINDDFIEETIEYKTKKEVRVRRIRKQFMKIVASAAAIIVLSFSGLSVAAAAGNMQAYEVLHFVHPEIAKQLIPVNASCEDQGIKMNVEAIHVGGNKADIYISVQDLESDRVDETIDLFDSYGIHTNADQSAGCEFMSYDEATKTATFLIMIEQEKPIEGKFMKFSFSKLLVGKSNTVMELSQIKNISEAENTTRLEELNIRGAGGRPFDEEWGIESVLQEDESQTFSPVDGVKITAYGFVDGRLHIQASYEDILKYDNHGYIYLVKGEEIVHPYGYSFWGKDQTISYDEDIFDISPEELKDYKVMGEFTTCDTLIEGNWEVSFPIENMGSVE